MKDDEKCEFCKYWEDYTDRVWACIYGFKSDRIRNLIELRRCKYNPPPPTMESIHSYHTNKDYYCSAFKRRS